MVQCIPPLLLAFAAVIRIDLKVGGLGPGSGSDGVTNMKYNTIRDIRANLSDHPQTNLGCSG